MADNALKEMVAAFGSGCLDKENYKQFKDYLDRNGKLPGRELGDIQNMVSLIPLILEEEIPEPRVKDAVAKKLLSYQDEIKAKIRERKEKGERDKPSSQMTKRKFNLANRTKVTEESASKPVSKEVIQNGVNQETPSSPKNKVEDSKVAKPQIQDSVAEHEEAKSPDEMYPHRKEGDRLPHEIHQEVRTVYETKIPMWIWLVVVAVAIAGGVVSYMMHQNNVVVEGKLIEANKEVTSLKALLAQKENELYTNQILIDFLNKDDIDFVKFTSSDLAPNASGKLFLSFASGEGLMELSNLPPIEYGKAYHLWIVSQSRSFSALEFLPDPDLRFIKIPKLPYISREEVDLIRITVEDQHNADVPLGSTYLYGVLNSNN